MLSVTSQLYGDFQQGGLLLKQTRAISKLSVHLWMSDRPKKLTSIKADQWTFSPVVGVACWFTRNENCVLTFCALMVSFGKFGHKCLWITWITKKGGNWGGCRKIILPYIWLFPTQLHQHIKAAFSHELLKIGMPYQYTWLNLTIMIYFVQN